MKFLIASLGDQSTVWHAVQVSIGRRRRPFRLHFVAYPGDGDGGIAIDEISFSGCSLPDPCDGDVEGKFR